MVRTDILSFIVVPPFTPKLDYVILFKHLYYKGNRTVAKSVRFNRELESLLEEAAQALGVSQSTLIRTAIAEKCQEVLRPPLSQSLLPFIGRIKSKGGRARSSGASFKRVLSSKKSK